MAVITIIGIFFVLAAPSLSNTFDDQRAGATADSVAQMFRVARTRAAFSGGAHAVMITQSGAQARLDLIMAVDPTTGSAIGSCFSPIWSNAPATAGMRLLMTIDPINDQTLVSKNISIVPSSTAVGTVCFTPGGSMWFRPAGSSIWKRPLLQDHYDYEIHRTDGTGAIVGLIRTVRIGTTGVPRVDVTP